jgi:putative flippase GtrA
MLWAEANHLVHTKNINEKMVDKFVKYSLVGILGTIIDFSLLIFQIEILKINLYIATIISFILAATSNHFWNRKFTFNSINPNIKKEYLKFILVSIIGIIINLIFIFIFFDILEIHYIFAKIIATIIVLAWNFLLNYHWTFKRI